MPSCVLNFGEVALEMGRRAEAWPLTRDVCPNGKIGEEGNSQNVRHPHGKRWPARPSRPRADRYRGCRAVKPLLAPDFRPTRDEAPVDEPITPELALIDPDLAHRAREQLPARKPERRAVQVERSRSADARLAGPPDPLPFDSRASYLPAGDDCVPTSSSHDLSLGATVAILRVEPLRHFVWESRETALPPAGISRRRLSRRDGRQASVAGEGPAVRNCPYRESAAAVRAGHEVEPSTGSSSCPILAGA